MKKLIFLSAPRGSGKSSKIQCIYDALDIKSESDVFNYDNDELTTSDKIYKKNLKKIISEFGGEEKIKKIIDVNNIDKLDELSKKMDANSQETSLRLQTVEQKSLHLINTINKGRQNIIVHTPPWSGVDIEICGRSKYDKHKYIKVARENNYKFILVYIFSDLETTKKRVVSRFLENIKSETARSPHLDKKSTVANDYWFNNKKLADVVLSKCIDRLIIFNNNKNTKKDECKLLFDTENGNVNDIKNLPYKIQNAIKHIYGGKIIKKKSKKKSKKSKKKSKKLKKKSKKKSKKKL